MAGARSLLVLADIEGRVTLAEGSDLARFGLEASGLVGRSFAEAYARWPIVVATMASALAGKVRTEVIAAGGAKLRIQCAPRSDERGVQTGALLFGCPAGPRGPTLGGQGLELLMEHTRCSVWSTDASLRVTQSAGRLRGWTGPGRERIIGSTVQQVIGVDDPGDPLVRAHVETLAGSPRSVLYRLGHYQFQVYLRPLRDGKGEIIGCAGAAVDVTESAENQERLARSEHRLAEAQRIAHVGSWEWEVADNTVRWSDELYRVYGLEKGQFPGTYEAFLERVLPEDREYTRTVVFEAYRKAQPFMYDHRVVRPDGSVRMLHTCGDVMVDEHGKVLRLAGACWDMTELWEATRALKHSISLLGATLESTADGILVIDRADRVVTYNRRLLELWSFTRERIEGASFQALIDAVHGMIENADSCQQSVNDMRAHPGAESFDAIHFRDGRFYERYSRPQRVGDEVVGRVWSYRDVTQRETLLHGALFLADASRLLATLDIEPALEAMARLALGHFGDAIAVDLISGGNPRRLLVLSRGSSHPIPSGPSPAATAGQPVLYSIGSTSIMAIPLRARGELTGILTFAARLGQTFGEADLASAAELGRRVELALENARLYSEAREALAARDEFLSVAAHEIRGPLTSLRLAVEGLQQDLRGTLAGKMLSVIDRENRRISELVDELLDVARVRGGQLRFVFSPVDLVEVARSVMSRLGPEMSRSGSSLSVTTPAKVVGTWDRTRLDQVVSNLVGNAIKFGLGRPIEVSIATEGKWATLSVSDHGIGIDPGAQQRIFAPFERAVSARHYGGLGLGLYIVKTILTGLAGSVELRSQPGQGTTFTVRLPVERAA